MICRLREILFLRCPSLDDHNNHYDLLGGLASNWNVAKPTLQIFPKSLIKRRIHWWRTKEEYAILMIGDEGRNSHSDWYSNGGTSFPMWGKTNGLSATLLWGPYPLRRAWTPVLHNESSESSIPHTLQAAIREWLRAG